VRYLEGKESKEEPVFDGPDFAWVILLSSHYNLVRDADGLLNHLIIQSSGATCCFGKL
jgi:hypothetical protein